MLRARPPSLLDHTAWPVQKPGTRKNDFVFNLFFLCFCSNFLIVFCCCVGGGGGSDAQLGTAGRNDDDSSCPWGTCGVRSPLFSIRERFLLARLSVVSVGSPRLIGNKMWTPWRSNVTGRVMECLASGRHCPAVSTCGWLCFACLAALGLLFCVALRERRRVWSTQRNSQLRGWC